MKKSICLAFCGLIAVSAASPATAQFGLKNLIPGGQSVPGAAVDPNRFLADTLETTKLIMVAAALLAQASRDKDQLAAQASYIKSVNDAQDCKELESHKAKFEEDVAAISANEQSTSAIQAAYAQGSAEQKKLIAAALFNLMLGIWRNIRLSQEASQLTANIKANPMLLMKVPKLVAAANLVVIEVRATGPIVGSLQKVMSTIKVQAPEQAETTKAQQVSF